MSEANQCWKVWDSTESGPKTTQVLPNFAPCPKLLPEQNHEHRLLIIQTWFSRLIQLHSYPYLKKLLYCKLHAYCVFVPFLWFECSTKPLIYNYYKYEICETLRRLNKIYFVLKIKMKKLKPRHYWPFYVDIPLRAEQLQHLAGRVRWSG